MELLTTGTLVVVVLVDVVVEDVVVVDVVLEVVVVAVDVVVASDVEVDVKSCVEVGLVEVAGEASVVDRTTSVETTVELCVAAARSNGSAPDGSTETIAMSSAREAAIAVAVTARREAR